KAIGGRKVNWVLDLDIRGFFDAIDPEWLIRFIEHRIKDSPVLLFVTLIHWIVCASKLEAGAQCISSARWDLYGGWGVPSNRHSYREPLAYLINGQI
ncbi:MAG: hypothetical protein KJ882_01685, partial [Proteobacteria bacterium]|nr:hypothetical protein [Pseudomonadota bacterium]